MVMKSFNRRRKVQKVNSKRKLCSAYNINYDDINLLIDLYVDSIPVIASDYYNLFNNPTYNNI